MEASFLQEYQERINRHTTTLKQYNARLAGLSISRLISFGVFVLMLVQGFRSAFHTANTLTLLLFLFIFFILVMTALNLKKKKKLVEQLLRINENEIAVDQGGSSFLYNGSNLAPQQGFTTDLNVFGQRSLFHVLNRAASVSGKQALVKHLSVPFMSPAQIIQYQDCVKELSDKTGFRQELLAQCLSIEDETGLSGLLQGVQQKNIASLERPFVRFLSVAWPVLGVCTIVYSAWSGNYRWALLVLVLGLMISGLLIKNINDLYNHISKRGYLYTQYAQCFSLISKQTFTHEYLQQKISSVGEAQKAFKQLSGIISWFDMRLNFLLTPFVNGLFLSDLLCARKYVQWNIRYQSRVQGWFDTLGEIEVLNSLATYRFNRPDCIFPVPVTEPLQIRGTGIGHPLMNRSKAVVNDISIGEVSQLHLITGSNMSGKSTYLRTIGLNILLAQAGAPVFAHEFVFTPVRLLTSFHHIDSLEESTSYFYAELKSLQYIIHSLDQAVPALVLLDEVMRGTNSQDKHDGTALLIKKLLAHRCLTLVATHDTELGVLEKNHPGKIENYCFESELTETGLFFDFKRRSGVAQMKNATYLMQQMGII